MFRPIPPAPKITRLERVKRAYIDGSNTLEVFEIRVEELLLSGAADELIDPFMPTQPPRRPEDAYYSVTGIRPTDYSVTRPTGGGDIPPPFKPTEPTRRISHG